MMNRPEAFARIRVAEVVGTLSLATDLGMGQPMEFALRTCLLAVRLADAIGLSVEDVRTTYYVALLRSAGCTAASPLEADVFGDEIAARTWLSAIDFGRPAQVIERLVKHVGIGYPPIERIRMLGTALATLPQLATIEVAHCEVAQQVARYTGLSAEVERGVAEVFERWDGRGHPRRLRGESIAVAGRVVAVAFDAVMFHGLGGIRGAVDIVRERSSEKYDPAIAEAFCAAAAPLLTGGDVESAWAATLAAEPEPVAWLAPDQFETAVRAVGAFADLLSPHFAGHSSRVAELSAAAAKACGLPTGDQTAVRLAGWVHDVGRSGISAAVWNKPGPLTDGERERVRLHTYYTERILARAPGLAQIGVLAGMHHERLDGSGYHRAVGAQGQPITARILAAADMFTAMCEPRPYRGAHTLESAGAELRSAVRAGRLDGAAAKAVVDAASGVSRSPRRVWPAGLSEREVEVLRLLVRGHSNREIGQALSVSPRTAGNHIQHIFNKLGVSTRAAATLFATQHDLLEGTPRFL